MRTPARDKNNNSDYFRPSQTHKELLQQTESEFMAQLVVVSALGVDTTTYCTLQHTGPLLQKRKLVLRCVKRKDKECVCKRRAGDAYRRQGIQRGAESCRHKSMEEEESCVTGVELRETVGVGGRRKRAALVFSAGF